MARYRALLQWTYYGTVSLTSRAHMSDPIWIRKRNYSAVRRLPRRGLESGSNEAESRFSADRHFSPVLHSSDPRTLRWERPSGLKSQRSKVPKWFPGATLEPRTWNLEPVSHCKTATSTEKATLHRHKTTTTLGPTVGPALLQYHIPTLLSH